MLVSNLKFLSLDPGWSSTILARVWIWQTPGPMPAIVWESLFSGAYQHMYHLKGTAIKDIKIIILQI